MPNRNAGEAITSAMVASSSNAVSAAVQATSGAVTVAESSASVPHCRK
ncbi:hypothetical protein PSR1_01216 [Anaeromyxobacter sp. PSR-1]|nr:hypothetical protein PSR1_01216 [Anaeromyxobacter sp. PSR-1]